MKAYVQFVLDNPHAYNLIWESLYIDKSLFIDYYDGFAMRYEKGLKESIEADEMHDVDTELVSYILMGISTFIGLKTLFNLGEDHGNVDEVVDKVMAIVQTGIFKTK